MGVFVLLLYVAGPGLGRASPELSTLGEFHASIRSAGLMIARPARRRDRRRHVRRAALCLPDDDRPEVGDRADRRRQQYRQFGRDGRRRRCWPSRSAASASAAPASCCWSRRCAWLPPGSAGSSTSPATDGAQQRRRSGPRRTRKPAREGRREQLEIIADRQRRLRVAAEDERRACAFRRGADRVQSPDAAYAWEILNAAFNHAHNVRMRTARSRRPGAGRESASRN